MIIWQSQLTDSQVVGLDVDELVLALDKAVQAICEDFGVTND